jgi:hypothetical protein
MRVKLPRIAAQRSIKSLSGSKSSALDNTRGISLTMTSLFPSWVI